MKNNFSLTTKRSNVQYKVLVVLQLNNTKFNDKTIRSNVPKMWVVLQLKNTKFNDKTIQRYLFFFGVRVVTFVVGQLLEEGVDGGGKLAEGLSVFGLVLKKKFDEPCQLWEK